MTSNYSFPPSMALATREDGSLETRDNAVMRELQVTPSSVPYYLTSILPLVSFSNPLPPLVSLLSLQVSRAEKEAILEYENHLAASSSQPNVINESNSYLLNQVTLMQPKSVVSYKGGCVWPFPHLAPMFGLFPLFALFLSCLSRQYSLPFLSLPPSPPDSRGPVRKLPATVIDLIKTVNRLKLGQLLCRCRSPDFLLDIIRRQVSPVGTESCVDTLRLHFSVFTLYSIYQVLLDSSSKQELVVMYLIFVLLCISMHPDAQL